MMRTAVLLLVACAACGCEPEREMPAPRTIVDARGALEELYLPASSAMGVASRPLVPGVTYRVVVEGTISLWRAEHWSSVCDGTPLPVPNIASPGPTGPVGVDAEWVWAWPTSSSLCDERGSHGPPPKPQRRLLVRTRSDAAPEHLPPPLETGMSPNHVYSYTITGAGSPAEFFLDDAPLEDNYGELRILIFPAASAEPRAA